MDENKIVAAILAAGIISAGGLRTQSDRSGDDAAVSVRLFHQCLAELNRRPSTADAEQ